MAKKGYAANSAAPSVIKVLSHEKTDLKRAAARTLGYIGNPVAITPLIKMANMQNDVILSIIAIESLTMLNAESALSELNTIAVNHCILLLRMLLKKRSYK